MIPASAELSATGGSHSANKAIDLDLSTQSQSVSSVDSTPWINVRLEKVHCIREVVEWNPDGTAQYTWTWSGTKFSCVGEACAEYHDLLAEVEGEDRAFPEMPNCKFGDSVKMQLINVVRFKAITVYEIAVFAPGLHENILCILKLII